MSNSRNSGKKILMVEDDPFTRYMMHEIAETLGLHVETAADGAESTRILQDRPDDFDLVLMDLHMPVMSGIDAVFAIRTMSDNPPRDLPIIAITSDVAYHNLDVIERIGMNGYASKPISPGKLLDIVSQHCSPDPSAPQKFM